MIKPAAHRVTRPLILAIVLGDSRYRDRTRRSRASPVVVSLDSTIIAPAIPRNPGEHKGKDATYYPSDETICWPVSPRVGNVKSNDPSLIEPVSRDAIQ